MKYSLVVVWAHCQLHLSLPDDIKHLPCIHTEPRAIQSPSVAQLHVYCGDPNVRVHEQYSCVSREWTYPSDGAVVACDARWDFTHSSVTDGRKHRVLSVVLNRTAGIKSGVISTEILGSPKLDWTTTYDVICTSMCPSQPSAASAAQQMIGIYWSHEMYVHKFLLTKWICHKTSNISRTKYQNFNDSRLVLPLSLPNLLNPCVQSRMKM